MRTIVVCVYWGPLTLGNYHIFPPLRGIGLLDPCFGRQFFIVDFEVNYDMAKYLYCAAPRMLNLKP